MRPDHQNQITKKNNPDAKKSIPIQKYQVKRANVRNVKRAIKLGNRHPMTIPHVKHVHVHM